MHGVGYRFESAVVTRSAARTGPVERRALPSVRTRLIGRDRELAFVRDLVRLHRLATVVGPGGVGNTTLALAAAHDVSSQWTEGVVFAELASARDHVDVTRAVADAAGVEGSSSRSAVELADHLANRSLLLVLDNCEHLWNSSPDDPTTEWRAIRR